MSEKDLLFEYLPEKSVDIIYNWIVEKEVHLKIARERKTKLGDYRPPVYYKNHRISVNYNLNKYSFLITLVHEFAHLMVWEKYKNKVEPHGKEWKETYRDLMLNFLEKDIFPADLESELKKSIKNSKASTGSEINLSRIIKKYDKHNGKTTLEELPENSLFILENGKRFKKGPKQRTRYKCLNIDNRKIYLVHALSTVKQLN
ncbi:MAG: sprT domain-containing protein [Marinilabiliales bacterium]|nr:MAG: sprT domain-containing protein [Marinilabiliales bacterium]